MKYVTKNLSKDEEIKGVVKINKLAIIPYLIMAVLLITGGIVVLFVALNSTYTIVTLNSNYTIMNSSAISAGCLLLVSSFIPLVIVFHILSLEVAVTSKRIIGKQGIISMKSIDIPLNQITNCTISCGFWGRIFKYETIEILFAGMKIVGGNSRGLSLGCVSNAREFINEINVCIENNKKIVSDTIAD